MATTDHEAAFLAEVRAEMGRQAFTQVALAARVDMTPISLHRRMTGKCEFPLSDAYRIADVLAVPLHELLARADRAVTTAVSA